MIKKTVDNKKEDDYWETSKKYLLNASLLNNCKDYKKEEIKQEMVDKLKPLIESPEYDD